MGFLRVSSRLGFRRGLGFRVFRVWVSEGLEFQIASGLAGNLSIGRNTTGSNVGALIIRRGFGPPLY